MSSRILKAVIGDCHFCGCGNLLYRKDDAGTYTFEGPVLSNLRGRDDQPGTTLEIDCPKCGVSHLVNLKEK